MKRALVCALAALVAVSGVGPAESARVRIRMDEPRLVDVDTVRLTGTARGAKSVRIQRYVPSEGRWRSVKRVRVRTSGRFGVTLRASHRHRVFRARAGQTSSVARVVQPAANPGPPSDECGPRPQRADGSHWTCTLSEDFDGTVLDRSLWIPQTYFSTGTSSAWPCYVDDPSVVSVHDGGLHLTVRRLAEPVACEGNGNARTDLVAGMVSTYRLFSQQYGRFEARIKSADVGFPGLQESFWMWPDDRDDDGTIWPLAGEIDIAEMYSEYPDLAVPFLHYTADDNGGPMPGLNTAWDCHAPRGMFHTYTLEWSATRLEILVDGRTCLVNTSGDPAFDKRYIIALTQALGMTTNAYDGRASLPATMTVDYVRAWK